MSGLAVVPPAPKPRGAEPASPMQIAKYGAIAGRIRQALGAKQWTAGDLNHALGKPRSDACGYLWAAAKGAPGATIRPRVSEVLGIPEADLKWTGSLKPPAVAAKPNVETKPSPVKPAEVLTFNATSDGMARIRLDVMMPVGRAMPLLRLLMDAGLVVGEAG